MNKWLELIFGLIFLIGAIYVAFYSKIWWGNTFDFWLAAGEFLKGGVFWLIAILGFLFIILGISDLKS